MLDRKINHIFSNLEEGQGVLPRKNLKTKKAEEAISGHFVRAILPSVNELFLPLILYAILIFKSYTYVCISLVCWYQCSDLTTLDNDIRKSGHYSEPTRWYPLIFAIPVIAVGRMYNLTSGVLQVLLKGTATLKASASQMQVLIKSWHMPQTLSKLIATHRCIYRSQLKVMDGSHFRLSDVTQP